MKKRKILIGVSSFTGKVPVETTAYLSLAMVKLADQYEFAFGYQRRMLVDMARNELVAMAIKQKCDYLLFVDDDVIVPIDGIQKLIKTGKDIVCGLLPDRSGKGIYLASDEKGGKITNDTIREDEPGRMKIFGGSMGFTLIKRSVFKVLFEEYGGAPFEFVDVITKGNKVLKMREDVTFSYRAREKGFESWCALDVQPYHIGKEIIYKPTYICQRDRQ